MIRASRPILRTKGDFRRRHAGLRVSYMEAVPNVANFCKSILSTNVLNAASRAVRCLRIYHRPFGIYGVLAISSYRLFGWPEELAAQPAGIKSPVRLRVRTSDVSIYYDVLLCEQYAIDLPFAPKIIV